MLNKTPEWVPARRGFIKANFHKVDIIKYRLRISNLSKVSQRGSGVVCTSIAELVHTIFLDFYEPKMNAQHAKSLVRNLLCEMDFSVPK